MTPRTLQLVREGDSLICPNCGDSAPLEAFFDDSVWHPTPEQVKAVGACLRCYTCGYETPAELIEAEAPGRYLWRVYEAAR